MTQPTDAQLIASLLQNLVKSIQTSSQQIQQTAQKNTQIASTLTARKNAISEQRAAISLERAAARAQALSERFAQVKPSSGSPSASAPLASAAISASTSAGWSAVTHSSIQQLVPFSQNVVTELQSVSQQVQQYINVFGSTLPAANLTIVNQFVLLLGNATNEAQGLSQLAQTASAATAQATTPDQVIQALTQAFQSVSSFFYGILLYIANGITAIAKALAPLVPILKDLQPILDTIEFFTFIVSQGLGIAADIVKCVCPLIP